MAETFPVYAAELRGEGLTQLAAVLRGLCWIMPACKTVAIWLLPSFQHAQSKHGKKQIRKTTPLSNHNKQPCIAVADHSCDNKGHCPQLRHMV